MCPSEELRASFEYSVKRQTRLRISFFLFFFFRLCLEVECRFESPFSYAYIIRTCASVWGRRPSYSITYAQNLSAPVALECPLYIDMYLYWLWRKLRKERSSLTRIQIKKKTAKRKFRAVRPKASKWPEKGFLPSRHNEAICRIFCLGSLRFTSNLAFVC